MDWGSEIRENPFLNPGSRGSERHRIPDPRSATLKERSAHHECGFEIAISSHMENKEAAAHHEVGLRDGEPSVS